MKKNTALYLSPILLIACGKSQLLHNSQPLDVAVLSKAGDFFYMVYGGDGVEKSVNFKKCKEFTQPIKDCVGKDWTYLTGTSYELFLQENILTDKIFIDALKNETKVHRILGKGESAVAELKPKNEQLSADIKKLEEKIKHYQKEIDADNFYVPDNLAELSKQKEFVVGEINRVQKRLKDTSLSPADLAVLQQKVEELQKQLTLREEVINDEKDRVEGIKSEHFSWIRHYMFEDMNTRNNLQAKLNSNLKKIEDINAQKKALTTDYNALAATSGLAFKNSPTKKTNIEVLKLVYDIGIASKYDEGESIAKAALDPFLNTDYNVQTYGVTFYSSGRNTFPTIYTGNQSVSGIDLTLSDSNPALVTVFTHPRAGAGYCKTMLPLIKNDAGVADSLPRFFAGSNPVSTERFFLFSNQTSSSKTTLYLDSTSDYSGFADCDYQIRIVSLKE